MGGVGLRKIIVSVPDNLLKEIDLVIIEDRTNRSHFTREAMKYYLRERRRAVIREELKRGYIEMAEINSWLTEICLEADNDQQICYEERLREMGSTW